MRHITLSLVLLLGISLLAAQSVVPAGRDGFFWRLASEAGNYNNWNEPGPDDDGSEQTTYYYSLYHPSQLDSMVTRSYNSNVGSFSQRSVFTRTDMAGHYQIEEARFSLYMGYEQFSGLIRRLYDWQDRLYQVDEYNSDLFQSGRYEYTYDAAGNETAERVYGMRDGAMQLTWENLRSYDALRRVTHRQVNVWSTFADAVVTRGVEDYFFGAFSQPDSMLFQHYALSPDSEYQSVIVHKYNSFDANGNAVARLDLLTALPDDGAPEQFDCHTVTQYVNGGQSWYPVLELSHGALVNDYWGNYLYVGADSTLATWAYSDGYRRVVYNWQSIPNYWSTTRTTQSNAAGLVTSESTSSNQGSNGGNSSHTWNWEYVDSSSVQPPTPPAGASLSCSPNPFRESLELRLKADAGPYRVEVFNLRGQLVRSLADGTKGQQDIVIVWDGSASLGSRAPSGIYIIRAHTASGTVSARVSLIH